MQISQPKLPELFAQLGMDTSDAAIERFFAEHSLSGRTGVVEAPFLKTEQKITLLQMRLEDAEWADLVDEMDARLHH